MAYEPLSEASAQVLRGYVDRLRAEADAAQRLLDAAVCQYGPLDIEARMPGQGNHSVVSRIERHVNDNLDQLVRDALDGLGDELAARRTDRETAQLLALTVIEQLQTQPTEGAQPQVGQGSVTDA